MFTKETNTFPKVWMNSLQWPGNFIWSLFIFWKWKWMLWILIKPNFGYLSYSQHFPGVSAQNRGCKVVLDTCVLGVSSDNASACKYEFVI